MKYTLSDSPIPQDQRADVNEKILALIHSTDMQGITHQDVFEAYTGIGGLHNLKRSDFRSYNEFADAKKEIEQGQFFTPGTVIEPIAALINVKDNEFIADITCGHGAFINHFPEANCYGCELDVNAYSVAQFLYPLSKLQCKDLKYYRPGIKFDYIVGNPPFNLVWKIEGEEIFSQQYFCQKADELLKPGGLMICICPQSFIADPFFNKSVIEDLDSRFNFIFQYHLPANAFASMGVASFDTKVIAFQKRSEFIEHTPYTTNVVTYEQAKQLMIGVHSDRHKLRVKLQSEFLKKNSSDFTYKLSKYLYEIKTHAVLKPYYAHAMEIVEKFNTQVRPAKMEEKEWDKVKLTENKVLSSLWRIIKKQNYKPVNKTELVKTQYGFKLKPYSDKAKHKLNKQVTHVSMNDLVTDQTVWQLIAHHNPFWKLAWKKKNDYKIHTKPFDEFERDLSIDTWLRRFSFVSPKDNTVCSFNDIQFNDLGIILQKRYGILNWQQGCGKTAAAYAVAKYRNGKNTFIIGPALAINLTWVTFMEVNNENFILIKGWKDLAKIKPGDFVLMSLDMVISIERHLKAYIKRLANKVTMIFDESDEITNAHSKRTRAVNNCFRKSKFKLLATGTTTRNNITELYSQIELLYNNSYNMTCWCEKAYSEETIRVKDTPYPELAGTEIREFTNRYFGLPFPPYFGPTTFKRCFNPAKSSVFGIAKHNQDIYNEEHLRNLIGQTIITRKFREIAGDKYSVHTVQVQQTMAERHVYSKIIRELHQVIPQFFKSTGSHKKDSMLNIIRQLNLLIKATSMPQSFDFYHGEDMNSKASKISTMIDERDQKVALGCTSIEAVNWYYAKFSEQFTNREIFRVVGEINFKARKNVIKEFEATTNGILICTQQSLKSSVNIPGCNEVILESLQWNIPKMEQFYFRFIRYDSDQHTNVTFVNYAGTIEMNLLALLMAKEKLNDYIKTLEYRADNDIYDEFGIDTDILSSILTKEEDKDGNMQINWGNANVA